MGDAADDAMAAELDMSIAAETTRPQAARRQRKLAVALAVCVQNARSAEQLEELMRLFNRTCRKAREIVEDGSLVDPTLYYGGQADAYGQTFGDDVQGGP